MVSNYKVELGNVGNSLDSDVDAAWDTSLAETGESVDPNVPVVDLLPDSGHQLEGQFDGLFGGPEPAVQFSSESGDVARPPVGSFSAADSQVDDIGSDGGTHFIFPKLLSHAIRDTAAQDYTLPWESDEWACLFDPEHNVVDQLLPEFDAIFWYSRSAGIFPQYWEEQENLRKTRPGCKTAWTNTPEGSFGRTELS